MSAEELGSKSELIKPKVSILPDGKLAVLNEGNGDYLAQQEKIRQESIGDRKHFGPKDRGEVFGHGRDGEVHIDDEQNTDIVASELEERFLENPDDESIERMLDFIKSLHPSEARSENLSIFGLGSKKLEDLKEQIDSRPMSLEDRQKLEAQAKDMQQALDYYADRLHRISGEDTDARASAYSQGDDHMTEARVRNATREAASRVLDEHNQRVDRNRERKSA
jgi:hypothetical protein